MKSFRATITLHRGANLYKLIRTDDILSALSQTQAYIALMIGADMVKRVDVSLITPHELPVEKAVCGLPEWVRPEMVAAH